MKTGIFFYHQRGERLKDFPQALKGVLEKENVFFYDAFYPSKPSSSFDLDPISDEILSQVHSPHMVEEVKKTGIFEGALLSASGTVRAAEKIWIGDIDNAFVFTGYGDHHAGPDFFLVGDVTLMELLLPFKSFGIDSEQSDLQSLTLMLIMVMEPGRSLRSIQMSCMFAFVDILFGRKTATSIFRFLVGSKMKNT
jgi:hypothetical protein